MNRKSPKSYFLSRILTFLMGMVGIYQLYMSSPFRFHLLHTLGVHFHLTMERVQWESALFFMLAALNLLFIPGLYRRTRLAWIVEGSLVLADFLHHALFFHLFFLPVMLLDAALLGLFLFAKKEFNRKTRGLTVKGALQISGILLVFLLLEGIATVLLTHPQNPSFREILTNSVSILLGNTDHLPKGSPKNLLYRYQETLWVQSLIVLGVAVVHILRPLIRKPKARSDLDLPSFVLAHGQNPLSYLTLEKDKALFYGQECPGVCGYKIVNGVFVICGDILCQEEDAPVFLEEILGYCKREQLSLLLLNTTGKFLDLYEEYGLTFVKYGEDACFCLEEYTLAGKKAAKVRAAINHANKEGLVVEEYFPPSPSSSPPVSSPGLPSNGLQSQLEKISREWLRGKGGLMMEFSVGTDGLKDPMDRRYFYARKEEEVLGFVVFTPYKNKKGYLADVTRRKEGAPQGVLEKTIYDAFMKMKEEGVLEGNMGLAPLANIQLGKNPLMEKIFSQACEKLGSFYDFKALHHSKEKFGPTSWEDRYLVWKKGTNPLKIVSALVFVQYPQKISRLIAKTLSKKEGTSHDED